MALVHEARLRVRYAETDQMGVVYYANYLVWMEVGRVGLCKECGFNYRDMERDDGIFLVVAEAQCRYTWSAHFDDEVVVRTWIAEARPRVVKFAYEMRLADGGRELAHGYTVHVFTNRQMRPTRVPKKYYPMFGIALEEPSGS